MKVITTYYYECDGGINPPHHHPTTVEVNHVEQYQVRLNGNKYDTLGEAEAELCRDYDRVTLVHIKTAYHQKHERVVKWEQN